MAFPPDPVRTDVVNATVALDEHPRLHNELAAAINDTVPEVTARADAAQLAAEAASADDLAGHEALLVVHRRTGALKTASTTAPNNTLAADPHLFLDLAAGVHAVTFVLWVRGNVSDDFQAQLRAPDDLQTSGRWALLGPATSVTLREGIATFATENFGAGNTLSCGTGGTSASGEVCVRIEGNFVTAVAQRLTLWWAPVANGVTTEVRSGAYAASVGLT